MPPLCYNCHGFGAKDMKVCPVCNGYGKSEHYRAFSEDDLRVLAVIARNRGWELDSSPSSEMSIDTWWIHGGTFKRKRECDLFDELSPS